MFRNVALRGLPVAVLLLAGCGDSGGGNGGGNDGGVGGTDGGPRADGGPVARDGGPAAPAIGTCTRPQMVTGTMGTVSATFDTTDGPPGPLDLGNCGNPGADTPAPQHVIAYQVPGTGIQTIEFSLVNEGTPADFDTVVQVRGAACTETPVDGMFDTCFDDAEQGELRSAGATSAMGGSTIYFVVTGYPGGEESTDQGAGTIEFTARANARPVLSSADAKSFGTRVEIDVTGMDADGDIDSLYMEFLDAAGMPVDVDPAADGEVFNFRAGFEDDPAGQTTLTTYTVLDDEMRQLSMAMVAKLRLSLVDTGNAVSEPIVVNVRNVSEAGLAATCDDTHICSRELACTAGTCAAAPANTAACTAATPIVLPVVTTTAMSVDTTTSLPTGTGHFAGTCGGRPSNERLFTFTTPATGMVDVLVTTDVEATGEDTDTVLYVRTTCANPAAEPAMNGCNDDVARMNVHSGLELLGLVPATTYTLFLDHYGDPIDAEEPVGLRTTVRPVLATGAACDPAGVMNRCATGRCGAAASVDGGAADLDAGTGGADAGPPGAAVCP